MPGDNSHEYSSRQDPHYTDNSYHQPDYYDKQRYPSRDDSRSMNTSHTVYNQPHYSSASYNPYASLPNPHSLPPQPHSGYGMLPQYAHINPQFVYGNLNFGYMMPTYAPPPPFPHASRPLSASDSSVHVRVQAYAFLYAFTLFCSETYLVYDCCPLVSTLNFQKKFHLYIGYDMQV